MKNMKIAGKITFGFAIVIALMVVIAVAVLITNLMTISGVGDVKKFADMQTYAIKVNDSFFNARIYAKAYTVYEDNAALDEFKKNYETAMKDIADGVNYAQSNSVVSEYAAELNDVSTKISAYNDAMTKVTSSYATANDAEAKVGEGGAAVLENLNKLFVSQVNMTNSDITSANPAAALERTKKLTAIFDISTELTTMRVSVRDALTFYKSEKIASSMASSEKVRGLLTDYKKLISLPADIAVVDELLTNLADYETAFKNFEKASEDNAAAAAESTTAGGDAVSVSTQVFDDLDAALVDVIENTSNVAVTALVIVIVIAVVAIIVAVTMSMVINKAITPPLVYVTRVLTSIGEEGQTEFSDADWEYARSVAAGADEVAQSTQAVIKLLTRNMEVGKVLSTIAGGDLTPRISVLSPHDTMGNALSAMLENLNSLFKDINGATGEVTSGAEQISDGAQNLAQGSTEQAATVEELSASIQDIAAKTKENSSMANNAANLAMQMKTNAEKGSTQMAEMTKAVDEINLASQNISKVIKVIDDIAFQTNILALNAAVEAARAGEAGKGFAVVADEVRNLASKSAAAAKETGTLIENSMQKAELGARIASETSSSLSDIVSGINESTTIVESIAESSEEQTTAIAQINEAIEQVSQVVQRNSATAEESAASSEELNAQASILSRNVAKFTLK